MAMVEQKHCDTISGSIRGVRKRRRAVSFNSCVPLYFFASTISISGPAFAQQYIADRQFIEKIPQVSEVVVTAEKRPEILTRVPLAVTALSMSQLTNAGVVSVRDLASVVPNTEIKTVGFANSVQIAIRGITNADFNQGTPAVATYVDGIYIGRTQGLGGALYDLDRVEVLRGPQGTLYGRNSTGGNVNIVTNDPIKRFAAQADASYGNYGDVQLHGMLNAPVGNALAIRGAIVVHKNDGYYNTEGTAAHNYGKSDDYGGRITAIWTPNSKFDFRLSVDDFISRGTPGLDIDTGANGKPVDGLPVFNRPVPRYPEPSNSLNTFMVRARMNWRITNDLSLTYLSGYQNFAFKSQFATSAGLLDGRRPDTSNGYSHEVDVTYTSKSLTNILGAEVFRERQYKQDNYDLYNAGLFFQAAYGSKNIYGSTSWGVFDQATYSLTDAIRIVGGLRYSAETVFQDAQVQYFCPLPAIGHIPLTTTTLISPDCIANPVGYSAGSYSHITWRAGLAYDLSSQTSTYATVTTGFKSGGINPGAAAVRTFNPETVTDYEAGIKAHVFDKRVRLNAAIFFSDYRNLQVDQIVGAQDTTENAGAAKIYGAELEGEWWIASSDNLSGFLNYLHATYSDYKNAVDQQNGNIIPSLKGRRLPDAPQWSLRLQYYHNFPLNNGGTIKLLSAIYWQSMVYLRGLDLPVDRVGQYAKTDLNIIYTSQAGTWELIGYVHNLENNTVRNNGFTAVGRYYSNYNIPRTFGVRVAYKY